MLYDNLLYTKDKVFQCGFIFDFLTVIAFRKVIANSMIIYCLYWQVSKHLKSKNFQISDYGLTNTHSCK